MSLAISPATMRILEAESVAAGTPAHRLIETAGAACAQAIMKRWPMLRRVLICVGPGNNGADACVCARVLAQGGVSVTLLSWQRPRPDAWLDAACAAGAVHVEQWEPSLVERLLPHVDVVIDGLLGIGLSRPPADMLSLLIESLSRGLRAATGLAALTLSFGQLSEAQIGAFQRREVALHGASMPRVEHLEPLRAEDAQRLHDAAAQSWSARADLDCLDRL